MRTGGCRCGEVKFRVAGEPLGGIACHCRDCQYMAGGSPNLTWIFSSETLVIERGKPTCYKASPKSGGSYFCGVCGVQLFSRPDSKPELVAIKVGALDNGEGFSVQADMWMKSAPLWHHPHDGALRFEENMVADSE